MEYVERCAILSNRINTLWGNQSGRYKVAPLEQSVIRVINNVLAFKKKKYTLFKCDFDNLAFTPPINRLTLICLCCLWVEMEFS